MKGKANVYHSLRRSQAGVWAAEYSPLGKRFTNVSVVVKKTRIQEGVPKLQKDWDAQNDQRLKV